VVVELREGDDGVQEEMARTMVCRGRCVASCRRKEMRSEVSILTVMSRVWRRMARAKRSWKRHSYQEVQEDEVGLVARSAGSRCSRALAIPHQSFVWRAARSSRGRSRRPGAQTGKQGVRKMREVELEEEAHKRIMKRLWLTGV
jgi:hypothetical protein